MRSAASGHARIPRLFAAVCVAALLGLLAALADPAPGLRIPQESGSAEALFEKGGTTIDYGNASQGYILIKHEPSEKRLKVRITLGKGAYTYDLNGEGRFEVFPLQMGDGKYKVQLFQEAKAGKFSTLESKNITVKLDDDLLVYLYPNQFVNYGAESTVVAKSVELCEGLSSDADKVKAIFDFCRKKITYDYVRARSVKTGYLPDVDDVLKQQKGICFDYSAVMATMLRAQNIPAQLVIGYADKGYHAWNNVLVDGKWYRYDSTFAATGNSVKTYTEERFY